MFKCVIKISVKAELIFIFGVGEMRLKNKTAIITGAGHGIGRGIAELFYKEGANVVVTCKDDLKNLKNFAKEKISYRILALKSDASDENDVKLTVNKCIDKFGKIDILVNNVGISDRRKSLLDISGKEWDNIFKVNVKSMFLCCKEVIPSMLENKSGTIINIGSVASFTYQSGGLAYTASKHAVLGFTKKLAVEYGHLGIKINCICPGLTKSNQTKYVLDSSRVKDMLANIPSRRCAQPIEIANLALFLASKDSDYVQGSNFVIDGGRSLIY